MVWNRKKKGFYISFFHISIPSHVLTPEEEKEIKLALNKYNYPSLPHAFSFIPSNFALKQNKTKNQGLNSGLV